MSRKASNREKPWKSLNSRRHKNFNLVGNSYSQLFSSLEFLRNRRDFTHDITSETVNGLWAADSTRRPRRENISCLCVRGFRLAVWEAFDRCRTRERESFSQKLRAKQCGHTDQSSDNLIFHSSVWSALSKTKRKYFPDFRKEIS